MLSAVRTLSALAFLAPLSVSQEPEPAPVQPEDPVRVVAIDVRILASGPVMRVEQHLELQNPASVEQDFDLVFPLGNGAAIDGLSLVDSGRDVDGNLYSLEDARAIQQRMAEDARDPALLEHWGEAIYRARVKDVPAESGRTLVLSYTRTIDSEGGLQRLHVPLTAWRRSARQPRFSLTAEVVSEQPLTSFYSPTHAMERVDEWVTWDGDRQLLHANLRVEPGPVSCDLDFEAFLRTRERTGQFDVTVLTERPDAGEDGYFLAVIDGAVDDRLVPQPKNVVFVVDRSGSMKDGKLDQAREALKYMVGQLRPEDRFDVVDYAAATASFAEELVAPDPSVVTDASTYLDGLVPDGGTNIEAGLTLALTRFEGSRGGQTNQIVFLTDGLPTEGESDERRLCELVRERNLHGVRLITFGLGFDVNGALLDRLALQNRGLSEYVLPSQSIEEEVPGFYSRMHSPLLVDAHVEFEGGAVREIFPRESGDLYGGHPLVLSGRYGEHGEASIMIRGRRGTESVELELPVSFTDRSPRERDAAARIWATRKIGFLVDDLRLNGENPAAIEEIVRLGTRFGILTEYTAFLAEEDTDLYAVEDNIANCTSHFDEKAKVVSGTHGVAQACNSKALQRCGQASTSNSWVDASGQSVSIETVKCVNGRAFFRRGETWQDATVAGLEEAREVEVFSEEFYALLDEHPWLGRCVARTGDVTVAVEGEALRLCGGDA